MHKNRKGVLDFVRDYNYPVTIKQVANGCGINYKLASSYMFKLAKEGLLSKTISKKPARFWIK